MNLNPGYILTRDLTYVYTRVKNIIGFRTRLRDHLGITWGHMSWTPEHEEKLRYTYDLNSQSTVFDLGGYEGEWSGKIYLKYSPNIYVFEPIRKFYEDITDRFKGNEKIHVFEYGLAGASRTVRMSCNDVRSSEFDSGDSLGENVQLVKASDFFREHDITHIDLMKINIEGGEYELLEHLIQTGFTENIDNLQIQFHRFVPHARRRRRIIRKALSKTHFPTYKVSFVWENWKRRDSIAPCHQAPSL